MWLGQSDCWQARKKPPPLCGMGKTDCASPTSNVSWSDSTSSPPGRGTNTHLHTILHFTYLNVPMNLANWRSHSNWWWGRGGVGGEGLRYIWCLANQKFCTISATVRPGHSTCTFCADRWVCPFSKYKLWTKFVWQTYIINYYAYKFKKKNSNDSHLKTGTSNGITNCIFLTPRGYWKAVEPELKKKKKSRIQSTCKINPLFLKKFSS